MDDTEDDCRPWTRGRIGLYLNVTRGVDTRETPVHHWAVDDTTLTGMDDTPAARRGGIRAIPQLFLVFQCDALGTGSSRHDLGNVEMVELGRGQALSAARGTGEGGVRGLALKVPDRRMSSKHALLTRMGSNMWAIEDQGSKNGTLVNGVLIRRRTVLADGDVIEAGASFFLYKAAVPVSTFDALDVTTISLKPTTLGLLTLQPALALQLAELARVSSVDAPVAVLGETGTGKEVMARAIHALSGRDGPFVPVNCGAIPASLVESELFGHKKGAFTGAATDQLGLVRGAHGGTLFLDEIGDLPLPSQAALLRVLQEREVMPVGGRKAEHVDIRVISATNRDIPELVQKKEFRADLWARLCGFVLWLPPLRERKEDLGILLAALLRRMDPARADELALHPEAARALLGHNWPLNVRELEHLVRAGLALSTGNALQLPAFRAVPGAVPGMPGVTGAAAAGSPGDDDSRRTPDLAERRRLQLIALLKEHNGNVTRVAEVLGKQRTLVHRWMAQYGIDADKYRK
jgi:transcriptional regulator with PAS, ATPase and Fis domain